MKWNENRLILYSPKQYIQKDLDVKAIQWAERCW